MVYGDPVGQVEAALKVTPDFAMAHLTKAWMLTLPNDPGFLRMARGIVSDVGALTMLECVTVAGWIAQSAHDSLHH